MLVLLIDCVLGLIGWLFYPWSFLRVEFPCWVG